jgi:cytoskeleton protein RodZ
MFATEFLGQNAATMPSATIGSPAIESPAMDLVNLIERQLNQSTIYRQAVESLQQLIADDHTDGQMLLKAVSLEAIRLTLETIAAQPAVPTIASTATTVLEAPIAEYEGALDDAALDNDLFEAIASVTQSEPQSNPLSHLFDRYKAKRQHAAESVKVFTRNEILTQIGAQIQLEREQKGLTIAQLHARTFIPMYHLQAFEGGHVEQLPEDVYLRGFLRRIENALGMEVGSLIEKLPTDQAEKSILPSWAGHGAQGARRGFGGLDINPTHLYVTYAAIMAGGVCWLSNQATPTSANLPDLTNYEPRAEAPTTAQMQANRLNLNRTAQKIGGNQSAQAKSVKVGSVKNIAPPETLR